MKDIDLESGYNSIIENCVNQKNVPNNSLAFPTVYFAGQNTHFADNLLELA